jgi:hypothetical protein
LKLKTILAFENFNNMQLIIGGSRNVDVDPIKDAFSLLTNPNELVKDKMKLLFDQLHNQVTIFDAAAYLETDEEERTGT